MTHEKVGGENRRDVLKLLGLSGLGVVASSLGVPRAAFAASGGTITWARPSEAIHMDPQSSQLSSSWEVQHHVFDSLLYVDDDFQLQPALASAWEWQGNTLVFTLRDGVKFGNGRAMTQADVVGSLERSMVAKGSPWGLLLRNRKEIRAAGDNKVEIEFDGPNRLAEYVLAATLASIMPMTEIEDGSYDPAGDMWMGTGPYMVESHVANDRWVLVRNPHYWEADRPMADKLVVRTIPTIQGIIAALTDGSADIAAFRSDPDAALLLQNAANVEVVEQQVTNYAQIIVNTKGTNEKLHDRRVRQALAWALDRSQVLNLAFGGVGAETLGFSHYGILDDSKLTINRRDVDKAKALLAEAGASDLSLTIIYGTNDESRRLIAEVAKANLEEAGVSVTLEGVDAGVWVKRTWGSRPSEFDMAVGGYSGFAHPLFTAHWRSPSRAGFTAGYYPDNADFDAAIDAAMFAESEEDMLAAMQRCYEIMNEEAVDIPLMALVETVAYRTDKINADVSKRQGQNNTLAGVQNFEVL